MESSRAAGACLIPRGLCPPDYRVAGAELRSPGEQRRTVIFLPGLRRLSPGHPISERGRCCPLPRKEGTPMGVLADFEIRRDIKIEPFADGSIRPGTISFGVSSYGYDVRVGRHFKVFTNVYGAVVDPKNFDRSAFVDIEADSCIIPPNSFALAETVEYFEIPRDVLATCLGKSTYARCGIIVNVTPLEPEWRGKITIEVSNTTPLPAKVYANEGIAQILFFRAEAVCQTSYADKKGKYQDQKGLTLPFVVGSHPRER